MSQTTAVSLDSPTPPTNGSVPTPLPAYTAGNPASIDRAALLQRARRVVIKIGSAVLSNEQGELDRPWLAALAADVAELTQSGRQVILVSSGAVAAGLGVMGAKAPWLRQRRTLPDKQALAAIGQGRLMEAWRQAFGAHHVEVAQVLLTRTDMDALGNYLNARLTLERLLKWDIVPIINENDTTATEELRLGDNDELSAIVARKTKADLLVMLTSADGLMSADPRSDPEARMIPLIAELHEAGIEALQVAPGRSGRGGIQGKLRAARMAVEAGVSTVVAHGRRPSILKAIVAGDPEAGSLFLPRTVARFNPLRNFLLTEKGSSHHRLVVNAGAITALRERGSSLLPVGIVRVEGSFEAGEVVLIVDERGEAVAKGISEFSASELERVRGHRSAELATLLNTPHEPEAVHRDLMVLVRPGVA